MAKHYLYPKPSSNSGFQDRRVELHWQRDSGVQVASTKWAGESGTTPDTAVEYLPATPDGPLPAWDGEFVDLSRDQVNHLIKQLRVARDQAFGRDE